MSENNRLSWEEYGDFVTGLASPDGMVDEKARIGMGCSGLAGEGGECVDLAKKILYHGMPFDDKTKQKLMKETGDCVWYIAFLCRNVFDCTLDDLIEMNVTKLRERYKSGAFSVEEFMKKEDCKDD